MILRLSRTTAIAGERPMAMGDQRETAAAMGIANRVDRDYLRCYLHFRGAPMLRNHPSDWGSAERPVRVNSAGMECYCLYFRLIRELDK